MYRRSNEPLAWLPFSAGMMVDALAAPVLIVVTGFLLPFDIVHASLQHLLLNPIIRLLLFLFIALTFFHAAHRIRFTLIDLGIRSGRAALAAVCYGAAILGTIWAARIAFGGA